MPKGKTTTKPRQINSANGPRFYEVSGTKYPSVTSVLGVISKPALYGWYSKMTAEAYTKLAIEGRTDWPEVEKLAKAAPRQTLTNAGDLGTRVHNYIEALNTGQPLPEMTDDMAPSITAYHQWAIEHDMEIVESETIVYSDTYGYAGTLDAIGHTKDGSVAVLDYKTSSGIYDEYALQVASYAYAYGALNGQTVDEAWVLRFPKKPGESFEARQVHDWPQVFYNGFLPALNLWNMLNANKGQLWEG